MKDKWKQASVAIEDIIPSEINANSMDDNTYQRLLSNIKKTGLSSTIACYKRICDGKYVIISGNHRHKACKQLGFKSMNILFADESDMSRDEIIALQLSHNSVHGSDDRSVLKRLMDEIKDINFKEVAFVEIDELVSDNLFGESLVPSSEHYRVSLILYRKDINLLEDLLGIITEERGLSETIILADGERLEQEFIDGIDSVKKEYKIKSASVSFSKLLELAKAANVAKVTEKGKNDEQENLKRENS